MIDRYFQEHIQNTFTLQAPLRYGTAEGQSAPYYVMLKIEDLERPETLCDTQGDQGRALFQFSLYTGGTTGNAGSSTQAVTLLQALKNDVRTVQGVIGTPPNDYRIWYNETTGVTPIVPQENVTWAAIFETTIYWEKI